MLYEPGTLYHDLSELLNSHSMEAGSDTPDYILAKYLLECLEAFNRATCERDKWHNYPIDSVPHHLGGS